MPRIVENITDEPIQKHTLLYNDIETVIVMRFSSQTSAWLISAETGDKSASSVKLSVGVLHMISRNMPCDFTVIDTTGNDIDPFRIDDFSTGRCVLVLYDDEDMADIRGQEVEING